MSNKSLLHIPKNGGTTIRNLFEPYKPIWEKHACLQEIYDTIGEQEFLKTEYLVIVRNPWARLYSWWKYHRLTKHLREYQCDFSEWVFKWCPHHWTGSPHFGGKHGLHYKAYVYAPVDQKSFILVNNEIPKNIKILRLENMNASWDYICDFFGKSVAPRNDNRSAKRDEWKAMYNNKTKQIANELLADDLDWLKYEI